MVKSLSKYNHLGVAELGDGLGAFSDGVLAELTGQGQADSGLHLAGAEGGLLVHAAKGGSLVAHTLEHVIDKGVHDVHGALGDGELGVHLLQHTVDVDGVGLGPLLGALLSVARLGVLSGSLSHCDGLGLLLKEQRKIELLWSNWSFELAQPWKASRSLVGLSGSRGTPPQFPNRVQLCIHPEPVMVRFP